jgi:hypothetical protein
MTTHEHIQAIINTIDGTIKVTSVEVISSGVYRMNTSRTLWATIGNLLGAYKITDVVENVSITVKSNVALSAGSYTLRLPFFYYGTFLDTNKELMKKKNANDKLPFIYLHLNAPEVYASEMDLVDYESDCAIYFMANCDPKDWLTGDHYTNAIKPMKSAVRQFMIALSNYAQANASYNITFVENDFVNFGDVIEKGIDKKIFSDNISGVELLVKIPFNKCLICCN